MSKVCLTRSEFTYLYAHREPVLLPYLYKSRLFQFSLGREAFSRRGRQ